MWCRCRASLKDQVVRKGFLRKMVRSIGQSMMPLLRLPMAMSFQESIGIRHTSQHNRGQFDWQHPKWEFEKSGRVEKEWHSEYTLKEVVARQRQPFLQGCLLGRNLPNRSRGRAGALPISGQGNKVCRRIRGTTLTEGSDCTPVVSEDGVDGSSTSTNFPRRSSTKAARNRSKCSNQNPRVLFYNSIKSLSLTSCDLIQPFPISAQSESESLSSDSELESVMPVEAAAAVTG
jgi:hypothetical protein